VDEHEAYVSVIIELLYEAATPLVLLHRIATLSNLDAVHFIEEAVLLTDLARDLERTLTDQTGED